MPELVSTLHYHVFYGAIILLALLELWVPWRTQRIDPAVRWPTNFVFFAGNVGLERVLLPITAMELAAAGGVGLVDWHALPVWLAILAAVLALDLWKYIEHRLFHGVHLLWRLHRVHHADTEMDFTTAERHHPLEALATYPAIFGLVFLLGLPAAGIGAFAVLAGVVNLWSHANVRWPGPVDRTLRAIFVTPGMHVVHHSAARRETDSNFGLIFSVWDRLFGTYVASSPARDRARILGLEYFRGEEDLRLKRSLLLPFLAQETAGANETGLHPSAE